MSDGSTSSTVRRWWIVAAVVVALVAATSLGVMLLGDDESDSRDVADIGLPSDDRPADSSASTGVEAPGITEPATLAPVPEEDVPSGRIAYRLEGTIWVADEDGSNESAVIESPEGPFALSPDGRTLALVEPGIGHLLVVVDVLNSEDQDAGLVDVGPAVAEQPTWAPDSSWFAYTASGPGGTSVHTVQRNGDGDAALDTGRGPAVSPDGTRVAYIAASEPNTEGPLMIHVVETGLVREVIGPAVIEVDWIGGLVLYSTAGEDGASPSLATVTARGVAHREIVGAPVASRPVLYTRLCVSPDRRWVAYAHTGDDGYSRMYVFDAENPEPRDLSVRRDAYPLCWSADSSSVFFIEGNPIQGESTDLMNVRSDGTGRHAVVEGVQH